jgi:hypothetical protein
MSTSMRHPPRGKTSLAMMDSMTGQVTVTGVWHTGDFCISVGFGHSDLLHDRIAYTAYIEGGEGEPLKLCLQAMLWGV